MNYATPITTATKIAALVDWAVQYPALTPEMANCLRYTKNADDIAHTIAMLDMMLHQVRAMGDEARVQRVIDGLFAANLIASGIARITSGCYLCGGVRTGYQGYDERDRMYFTTEVTSKAIPCPACTGVAMVH